MMLAILFVLFCVILSSFAQDFNYINVRVDDDSELIIEHQNLSTLTRETFGDLAELRYIRLVNDSIEQIEPGALSHLGRLGIINLSFNKLTEIQYGIFNNVSVTNLYLKGNQIKYIAINAFDNIADLEELDLSNNQIEEINTGMFINTHRIRKIILNNNKIKTVPIRAFEHAVAMIQPNENSLIDLSHNEINFVHPYAFDGVIYIRTLLLNNNKIVDLNDLTFNAIRYVEVIDLSGNFIKTLSRNFLKTLQKCKLVDLSYNRLDDESVRRYIEWTRRVQTKGLIECDATRTCPKNDTIQATTILPIEKVME